MTRHVGPSGAASLCLICFLLIPVAGLPRTRPAVDPPDPLEERLSRARKALAAGDPAAAARDLVAASLEAPNTPGLLLAAAEALAKAGRGSEAVGYVERAAAMGGVGDPARLEAAFGPAATAEVGRALGRLRANETPITTGTPAFSLAEKDLIPEGIAWDPLRKALYVGSLHKRKIVRVDPGGGVTDFVPQAGSGVWSVLGMKVDERRRELWANGCNLTERNPPMVPDEPATRGQAGVFRFDLDTGRLVSKHLAGSAAAPLCFNDLVLTPDGGAFMSAGPDGIHRILPGGAGVERFAAYAGFVNGIASSDDGRLLFLADHLRGVQVMEVATRSVRPLRLPPEMTLSGIDGLYVRGRLLVGVQNGLGRSPERVVQGWLDEALGSVVCLKVLDRNRPEFDVPTTGTLAGDDFYYIASSQLRRFDKEVIWPMERLDRSVIMRTPLAPRACPG